MATVVGAAAVAAAMAAVEAVDRAAAVEAVVAAAGVEAKRCSPLLVVGCCRDCPALRVVLPRLDAQCPTVG